MGTRFSEGHRNTRKLIGSPTSAQETLMCCLSGGIVSCVGDVPTDVFKSEVERCTVQHEHRTNTTSVKTTKTGETFQQDRALCLSSMLPPDM